MTESIIAIKRGIDSDIIALIDDRRLERECFVRTVNVLHPDLNIVSYSSAREFLKDAVDLRRPRAVLLNIGRRSISDPTIKLELDELAQMSSDFQIVVLAASDDISQIIAARDAGATGYIPSSLSIDEIVGATKLAAAGSVVLKISSLEKYGNSAGKDVAIPNLLQNLTPRQADVAEGIRRGKSNKVIAYELDMCESTVKVHVRNIMRKLNVSNRTEAAFQLHSSLAGLSG